MKNFAILLCFILVLPLEAQTLGYVLQAEHLAPDRAGVVRALKESARDVIVLDEFFAEASPWTKEEIASIRSGRPGRRLLAYLSIGEAENYRPYWKPEWKNKPPAWMLAENPDWPGNFRVNYWDPVWQGHILAALRRIGAAGFDGVYLDIVDAFEGFEHDPATGGWRDGLQNPETGRSYRKDMIAWVQKIAAEARKTKPGFWVVPQNGVQLLEDDSFAALVDAVGVEDLFSDGKRRLSHDESAYRIGYLRRIHPKPVFVIEYAQKPAVREGVRDDCLKLGFSLLLTNRALDQLGEAVAPPVPEARAPSRQPAVSVEGDRLVADGKPILLNGVNVTAYSWMIHPSSMMSIFTIHGTSRPGTAFITDEPRHILVVRESSIGTGWPKNWRSKSLASDAGTGFLSTSENMASNRLQRSEAASTISVI